MKFISQFDRSLLNRDTKDQGPAGAFDPTVTFPALVYWSCSEWSIRHIPGGTGCLPVRMQLSPQVSVGFAHLISIPALARRAH